MTDKTEALKSGLVNAYIATRTPAPEKSPDWAMIRRSLECELFARAVDVILRQHVPEGMPVTPAAPYAEAASRIVRDFRPEGWPAKETELASYLARNFSPAAATIPEGVEAVRLSIINTPETADFMAGVPLEAAHQRERWGASHDAGKSAFDWFWLVGYLAQKAAASAVAGDVEKAKHHTISTAAALANWHAALTGETGMRPGIGPGNGGEKSGSAFDLASKLEQSA